MNIVLVDDHAVVRQGYASLLRAVLPTVQVREAASGEEALARVQEQVPDCRNCACCSSACTMNCRWCARRWTPGPRVT